MTKTTILNLYGGPGTGKSTSAAYLFAYLKMAQREVGLAQEYVKRWAWAKRAFTGLDEFYFLGKQIHEESMMLGKVPLIITDKPVLMDIYYAERYASPVIAAGIKAAVLAYQQEIKDMGHNHIHVLLNRTKAYVAAGRYQSEAEAIQMDVDIRKLLKDLDIPFIECGTDPEALRELVTKLSI